jgi:hypothetical protein
MDDQLHNAAVLTGDLVDSSKAGQAATDLALDSIRSTLSRVESWFGNGPGYFTRMRGDGWQFIVHNPLYTLRASLLVFAELGSDRDLPQTRISIGLDGVTALDRSNLSASSGPAFINSGQTLDAMTKADRFAIAGITATVLHRAVVALVEEQIGHWTPEQAEAVALYLTPEDPTLKDIGQTLGISTQAAHSRVTGAGGQALRQAVKYWEDQRDLVPC